MHPFIRFMQEFPGGRLADALQWLERHVANATDEERKRWASWYRPDTRENIALRYLAAWRTFSERAGRRHCPTPELSCREALWLKLPRAPRYVLTGRALMQEQAQEIVYATDTLFTHFLEPGLSDNDEWNTWALRTLGYDYLYERLKVDGSPYGWRDHSHVLLSLERIGRELGHINLKYLVNAWAAGSGWCHPSGELAATGSFDDSFRLGELILELNALTTRFGYLDLWLTLAEDNTPLLTLHADGGLYGSDETFVGGRSNLECYEGSFEPHGRIVTAEHQPRVRAMPDNWVVERGKLTAPTLWRMVPLRRNPTYRGPDNGWR